MIDCLAEVRFGVVFDHLGFVPVVEPCGSKGPDFSISREHLTVLVEVSRFVPMNPGPPEMGDNALLVQYGDPKRDIQKGLRKITGKFRQLADAMSALALWNDDDAVEDLEIQEAVRQVSALPDRPSSLQFVLLGSCWTRPGFDLVCFPLEPMDARVQPLVDDLRMVRLAKVYSAAEAKSRGSAV